MPKSFKARVKEASQEAATRLGCIEIRNYRLFTPYWKKGGTYAWMSPMDTDGLLVCERQVTGGTTTGVPPKYVLTPSPLLAVVLQTEEATGKTKPNPYGKASVVNVPLGLWVDRTDYVDNGYFKSGKPKKPRPVHTRVRLTHVWVMFVTRNDLPSVLSNLEVVVTAHSNSWYRAVSKAASVKTITKVILGDVRGFLVGKGRPKSF